MQPVPDYVHRALLADYGITGEVAPLPGELDLNFGVHDDTGRYVFKVMRKDCDPAFVDMQAKAMDHLARKGLDPIIPSIIRPQGGDLISTVIDDHGTDRIAWLISFLPGTLMADISPWTPRLAHHVGRTMATISDTLADFDHPLLDRTLKWDLRQGGWISHHLSSIVDPTRRRIVSEIADHAITALQPRLESLPHMPIHNDANEMNLLIDPDSHAENLVTGVIDFGDMIRTVRVCEPAVAMTYVMMRGGDWLARGAALAAGFHAVSPLSEEETCLLLPLVKARLAISVTNAAVEARLHPANTYLSISEAPAWQLLQQLQETDERRAEDVIRMECSS